MPGPTNSAKRPSSAISPNNQDSRKNSRPDDAMTAEERIAETIANLNKKITEIANKNNPCHKDTIQMMMLTSERDSLRYEWQLTPKIVSAILNNELTKAMSEGGSLREAIIYEARAATADLATRIENIEKEIHEVKEERKVGGVMPKKWEKVLQNERFRCIEASSKGLVLFGQNIRQEETGNVGDERLEDIVKEVVGEEEIAGWKRMAGRTALSKWNRDKPPTISIRLHSAAARERVLKKVRLGKKFDVKREIPDLLMDEFKELSKAAEELREKEGCQTYIGFGGSEVFLRRRKDETDKWRTVRRL